MEYCCYDSSLFEIYYFERPRSPVNIFDIPVEIFIARKLKPLPYEGSVHFLLIQYLNSCGLQITKKISP